MLTTIIVLPDGTEISSGVGTNNAIQSCTYTECVNSDTELTLGSVCSAMVEIKFITPQGGLRIAAGDELVVYKVTENGHRHQLGIFVTEKPTRPGPHTMKLMACDRVSRLDKDLTLWLSQQTDWPKTLYDFAVEVCTACGVELINSEIPNGSYLVQKFSAEGVTGRKLMQWVGQAAGRFCRATPDGRMEFAWYTPAASGTIGTSSIVGGGSAETSYADSTLSITDPNMIASKDGDVLAIESDSIEVKDLGDGLVQMTVRGEITQHFYFQGSLSFEDYVVAPIEKVQIHQNEEDVGVIWPNNTNSVNTYRITGNPLLADERVEVLRPVAQTLFEQLQSVSYTPCNVTIPATMRMRAGHIITVIDRNGKTISAYVMTKTQSGQKDVLECTGSARRDSVSAVNEQSYASLSGRVMNLRIDVEGIRAENKSAAGEYADFKFSVEGIKTTVGGLAEEINGTDGTGGLKKRISSVEQTANGLVMEVGAIKENGTSKVKTSTNYTFDENGLSIAKTGEQMENRLDNTGMYVTRSGQALLTANSDGVTATDVRINNYLIVGKNSRFEDYTGNRTACFYVGG